MFSKFFIERPIFSSVVSIIIVVAGLVTAAIAIPVALHNADKDKEPQS